MLKEHPSWPSSPTPWSSLSSPLCHRMRVSPLPDRHRVPRGKTLQNPKWPREEILQGKLSRMISQLVADGERQAYQTQDWKAKVQVSVHFWVNPQGRYISEFHCHFSWSQGSLDITLMHKLEQFVLLWLPKAVLHHFNGLLSCDKYCNAYNVLNILKIHVINSPTYLI